MFSLRWNITRIFLVCSLLFLSATSPSIGFSEKQGPFEWHPELSPTGPVVIIVSLTEQRVFVYRGGIRIGTSPVSTGKPGYETPTGVFTILQRDVHHHSSKYNNASMPYTERLTWSGVALHAGGLPGYPESHGCIHLSLKFSKLLFGITHIGTAVIIEDEHSAPGAINHPGPFLPQLAKEEAREAIAKLKKKKLPHPKYRAWKTSVKTDEQPSSNVGTPSTFMGLLQPHISILVSSKDRSLQVWNGDKKLLQTSITIKNPEEPLGTHLYTLTGINPDGTKIHWSGIRLGGQGKADQHPARVVKRIQMSADISRKIVHLLHPGATFTITDQSLAGKTRTGNGFVILTQR
ncbi:MAG: L,D-transpeptidase [bacterium]|nr:L,D-transpeptidase [bacterium]